MNIEARFRIDRGDFSLDVDLTIPGSGVTALFGPSGCGKTTLLRAMAGLERAPDGYLRVGDAVWQDAGHFLAPYQRRLGYVFQEPSLFPHLTVRRNLEYGLKRLEAGDRKVSLEQAVDLLGIGHLLERRPHQLSGGEQQRVAIARALSTSPAMLLLDEPLAALDSQRKAEILPYLDSLHRSLSIPVLYVSHSRREVARMADHLVLLRDGRVEKSGTVSDLFARLDLALAHEADAETVIDGIVSGREDPYGLTFVDFPGGRFAVTGQPPPLQASVRLRILARDVSLTLEPAAKTSILNILPATVEQVSAGEGGAWVTIRLQVGTVPLLARISRKSAAELRIQVGLAVYAQVKSVALLI